MLRISHIEKTFNPGTVNEKKALSDLSLELKEGDFATIIGSNGAGKSTLFNAISGSFFTDAGTIELAGKDITFLPEYQRAKEIGRLFQDPMRGSAPGMTIEENLALAAGSGGWFSHTTKGDRQRFRDRLALLDMGLEDRMKQPVGLLSGGQRQALTLMMATMNHGGSGPGSGGEGAGDHPADRGGGASDVPDGDPQHGIRPVPWKPDADDGSGPDHL